MLQLRLKRWTWNLRNSCRQVGTPRTEEEREVEEVEIEIDQDEDEREEGR